MPVASPDDTMKEESETDPILSHLEAEKKLCSRKRIGVAASRRKLATRHGSGESAAPPSPKEDNFSVVAGKVVEYKAHSQEQYCAELVSELTGVCTDAKPWTASSSDARYAGRPTVLDRMLLKAARIALSRLVETQVRDGLEDDDDETELQKELARCARVTVKLDAEEARGYVEIQELARRA
ncbi:hypothetical protein MTO96_047655 [Rhipicephalus appendiculatus]